MKKTTLAIVDDHKLIREMWVKIFSGIPNYEIVGESGEYNEALEMIKATRPDIVLLDINLAEASGMDAVPVIRKYCPGTRIIAVTMHNQPVYAKRMIKLGAKGYVTKNSSQKEILAAVEEVLKGNTYICSEVKDILSSQMMNDENDTPDVMKLSMREMEVIKHIKDGLSSKEIASNLNVSVRTIEVHRHNVLKKLKLKNTASLINYINSSNLNFTV